MFQTKHKLDFEVAEWEPLPGFPAANNFKRFRVGTCEGLWSSTKDNYQILAVTNKEKGNGHFEDVIEWFLHSCLRDKKNLYFLEMFNNRLEKHLVEKRGFVKEGNNVYLSIKKIKQNEK